MAEKTFVIRVSPVDRIQHRRTIERGHVLDFMVQYEILLDEKWIPVVRYDTAHGFAHRDWMSPRGESRKERLYLQDFTQAYTFAANDLRDNWERYRERFEMERRRQK